MSDIKRFEPLWGVWYIEKPLGEGSFGKVYKAVREDYGSKYYSAIKHISIPASEAQLMEAASEGAGSTKEELRAYFDRSVQAFIGEIRLMSEVKGNTNIVGYEDHLVVPKESGIGCDIFIRMELLTGLGSVISQRPLARDEVLRLGLDICTALEVCAAKNIIHRDIKPSNIFVSSGGNYKLGDFGVARELNHTTGGMSKKGTYAYMAPEIYRGEEAGRTADIYSLGIVMYRLLNGNRAPFLSPDGTITPRDNELALSRRMSGEALPAPAYADPALAAVILSATQFDRRRRYANPTAMKNALLWVRSGQAASARRDAPRAVQPQIKPNVSPASTAVTIRAATPAHAAAPSRTAMTVGATALPKAYAAAVGLEGTAMTRETLRQSAAKTGFLAKLKISKKVITAAIVAASVVLAVLVGALVWRKAATTITIGGRDIPIDVTQLDLSGMGLTDEDVVDLSRCTKLTRLHLGIRYDEDGSLKDNKITDLTPFADLTQLKYLNLSRCPYENDDTNASCITDISPLANLTELTWLNLNGNKIADLTPLAGLTQLSWLDLSDNLIADLTPLAGLTQLSWLDLSDNLIADLTPLAGLSRLSHIDLSINAITDIPPLAKLTKLSYLCIDSNYISDVSPLAKLTNLITLQLSYNRIADVNPLSNLIYLEQLYLDNNIIVDITSLFGLKNLNTLDVSYSGLSAYEKLQLINALPDCNIVSD